MNTDSSKKSPREVESVEYRPTKGGVISNTRFKSKRGGQGGGALHDYEHVEEVHKNMTSVRAHMKEHVGPAFAGEPDRDTKVDEE